MFLKNKSHIFALFHAKSQHSKAEKVLKIVLEVKKIIYYVKFISN